MHLTQEQKEQRNREYWERLMPGRMVQTLKEKMISDQIENGYWEKDIDEHFSPSQIRFCLGLHPSFEDDMIMTVLKQIKTLYKIDCGEEIRNLGVVVLNGGKERGRAMQCELDFQHWAKDLRKMSPVVINHGTHMVAYAA